MTQYETEELILEEIQFTLINRGYDCRIIKHSAATYDFPTLKIGSMRIYLSSDLTMISIANGKQTESSGLFTRISIANPNALDLTIEEILKVIDKLRKK